MKALLFSSIVIFLLFRSASAQTTDIGGIINTYTAVTSIDTNACSDLINVASATGFSVGDTVLLIQMKGASVDVTNTTSFGSVTSLNNAGNYEFAVIATVIGNQIGIYDTLQNSYDVSGYVQIVSVPVYGDANIISPLTAADWNGTTGGILVFFVQNTLTMNAQINLDGRGFRGGTISHNPDGGCGNNNINDFFYDVNQGGSSWSEGGAEKGEGIAELPSSQMGGKGMLANGGGGGNKHNTGGGGGGNYTGGGKGGNEMQGCSQNGNGGIGGSSLAYNLNKIFLGGGGGCGDFNNSAGTTGTDAGGMIIIWAGTLVGNGYTIHANGLDQNGSIGGIGDGAGGGGAGGTILLDVQAYSGSVTIQADGGDGGDQTATNTYGCFGPGGGGGAGVIWVSGTSLPGTVTTEMTPGLAGLVLNTSFSCYNTTYGAMDGIGTPNTYLTDLILAYPVVDTTASVDLDLGNDTLVCIGTILTFDASQQSGSYLWNTGDTTAFLNVDSTGTYSVEVVTPCGSAADTINVTFIEPPVISLGSDTLLCAGTLLLLDVTFTGANYYEWQDSSANSQFLVDTPGLYYVLVGAANCTATDTISIYYAEAVEVDLGNDTTICPQSTLLLNSFTPGAQFYLWQDGSTNSSFMIQTSGTYHVTITDSNGCKVSDTIFVDANIPLPVDLGEDTVVCAGTSLMLDATTADALSYLWNTNETTPIIEISDTLAYWVTVTNTCGTSSDTFALKFIDCELDVFVPNAFTPNDDGLNDEFRPITSNISSFQMSLFNRWGQLIFLTTDPEIGWDGKVKDVEQDIGVYVYLIYYTATFDPVHERRQLKGNFVLLR